MIDVALLARHFSRSAEVIHISPPHVIEEARLLFPGIDPLYFDFLREVGCGSWHSIIFFEAPMRADDIFGSAVSAPASEAVLIAGDYQGWHFGFRSSESSSMVELSPQLEISDLAPLTLTTWLAGLPVCMERAAHAGLCPVCMRRLQSLHRCLNCGQPLPVCSGCGSVSSWEPASDVAACEAHLPGRALAPAEVAGLPNAERVKGEKCLRAVSLEEVMQQ